MLPTFWTVVVVLAQTFTNTRTVHGSAATARGTLSQPGRIKSKWAGQKRELLGTLLARAQDRDPIRIATLP